MPDMITTITDKQHPLLIPEIITRCFHPFPQTSLADLHTANSVCRTWRDCLRPYLYRKICIHNGDTSGPIRSAKHVPGMTLAAFETRLQQTAVASATSSSSEWRHLQVLVVELGYADDIRSGRLGQILSTLADLNARLTHISILTVAFGQTEKDGLLRHKDHLVSLTIRAYQPSVEETFIVEQFPHLQQLTLHWDREYEDEEEEEGEPRLRPLTTAQEKALVKKLTDNCTMIRNIQGPVFVKRMSEKPLNQVPITHFSLEQGCPITIAKLHSQAKNSLKSLSCDYNSVITTQASAELLFGGFSCLESLTVSGETLSKPLPKQGFNTTSPVKILDLGQRSLEPPVWPGDQVGPIISYYSKTIEVLRIRLTAAFTQAILSCHNMVALFFNSFDLNAEFFPTSFTVDHVRGLIEHCPRLSTLHTNMISGPTLRALVDLPRLAEISTAWFPVIPSAFTLDDLEFLLTKRSDVRVDLVIVWGFEGKGLNEETRRGHVRQLEALVARFKDRVNKNVVEYPAVTGDVSGFRLATDKLWLDGSGVWWDGQ
ncbi:hypothetical protein HDU76_002116 [Blyttiomyces sp. JEL0837]|nr:hypothetical protein HDU76_002116 [Blyttiomyces sp. JEL0837]